MLFNEKQIPTNKGRDIVLKNPNIILYGPPGTGKTYNTVELAYEVIHGYKAINHKEAQDFFKQESGSHIEFITFHQNYAYEDFVIGIKPDTQDESKLIFKKKYGIFYRLCKRASDNYLESKSVASSDKFIPFNTVFKEYVKEIPHKKPQFGKKTKFYIYDYSATTIYYELESGKKDQWRNLSVDTLRQYYETGDLSSMVEGGRKYYYDLLYNKLLEIKEKLVTETSSTILENFVLIIDEINRANISRVFGELITLIEKDKRLGGDNEIRVSLPNGEEFAIPPNLYIIGTMNTADKSIALIDIALRRRFEFRKMYPLYEIKDHKVYHADQLKKMNRKIAELKSVDFQIGHSYFMGDGFDIDYTMNNKVIPLLYEYFMNDADSVKEVLKAGGFEYLEENKTDSGLIEFTETSKLKEDSDKEEKKD